MEKFLVGGAVRDKLLGRTAKDRDWVVTGSTPEEMIELGFKQVGADFPVFLSPSNGDEVALARQEEKTGPGYHGFETRFDPSVTIEEDLFRRDLTINAMAEDRKGNLIDPYGGKEDLKNGVLRHVSEAFAEDPVRVLRVARFAARFNFDVHESTQELMKELVDAGELDHLTPERVWSEMSRAMMEDFPNRFFWVLDACGAMDVLMPELKRNIIFTGMALDRMVLLEREEVDRFMVMFAIIERDDVAAVCDRFKAPSDVKMMSLKYNRFLEVMAAADFSANTLLTLMKEMDLFRQPDHLKKMVTVAALTSDYSDVFTFMKAFNAARGITFGMLSERQQAMLRGADIGKAIDGLRLKAIENIDMGVLLRKPRR